MRQKVFCAKLATGVCDQPERVEALMRERTRLIETKREQLERLQARIAQLEAALDTHAN